MKRLIPLAALAALFLPRPSQAGLGILNSIQKNVLPGLQAAVTNAATQQNTQVPQPTNTAAPTATITPSFSASPSYSASPSSTTSPTFSATFSASPSYSASPSPSVTIFYTQTSTASPSPTASASPTATASLTPTVSPSSSSTRTASASCTASPSITLTSTPTNDPNVGKPSGQYVTDGEVLAVTTDGTKTYLAGKFFNVGPRTGAAVLLNGGTGSVIKGSQISGTVTAAVSDGAGGWFVGGDFDYVSGTAQPRLAHLDSNGALMTAFNATLDGIPYALTRSGTSLYVGGTFNTVNSVASGHLVALNTTTGATVSGFAPQVAGNVYALLLDGGTLYAGGDFTQANGSTTRKRLAAFNGSTGALVSAFVDPDINGRVQALAINGSTLYAGGQFSTAAGGTSRGYLAAFNTANASLTSFNPSVQAQVFALAVNGGYLYVGGDFYGIGGCGACFYAARLSEASGIADTNFYPQADSRVEAFQISGSTLYMGGEFLSVYTDTNYSNLVALDISNNGALISGFNPKIRQPVMALALDGSTLMGAGRLSSAGMQFHLGVARIDNATGAVDPFYCTVVGGYVDALALNATGSTLYIGGYFFGGAATVNSVPRSYIAAVDTSTSVVSTSFNPTVNGQVRALAFRDNKLYLGGDFTQVNSTSRGRLAALNEADGSLTAFDPQAGTTVQALHIDGSRLYVAGAFNGLSGEVRYKLGAFDASDNLDYGFNSPLSNLGTNYALASDANYLYVGGDSTEGLHVLDKATGNESGSFAASVNGIVFALAARNGVLYAGGQFTTANSTNRNGLAAFNVSDGSLNAFDPAPDRAGWGIVYGNLTRALVVSGSTLLTGGTFTEVNKQPAAYYSGIIIP